MLFILNLLIFFNLIQLFIPFMGRIAVYIVITIISALASTLHLLFELNIVSLHASYHQAKFFEVHSITILIALRSDSIIILGVRFWLPLI